MLRLDDIDEATLLARGMYSTVRAAHEDGKKELSVLCGKLQSIAAQILKSMQPDNNAVPNSISDLIVVGRQVMDQIERLSGEIESLARQRAELKERAWKD